MPWGRIRSATTAPGWSGWRPCPACARWYRATAASATPASSRRRLALDAAYLDAVSAGQPRGDPRLTADSPEWMRDMHEAQVRYFKG